MSEICITPLYPELAEEHRRLQRQMILDEPAANRLITEELVKRLDNTETPHLVDGAYSYLAMVDGQAVGGVTLRPGPESPLISGLLVEEPYRRRGIGRALIHQALDVATKIGYQQASLWVYDENQVAYNWYLRLGFAPTEPPTLRRAELGQPKFEELLVKSLSEKPNA